jgi:NAD+ dependent glucose-6-phosphate dehydrogenase
MTNIELALSPSARLCGVWQRRERCFMAASGNGKKKVLVTGATGVIGKAVREMLADQYDLHYLTRSPADFPSFVADITDLEGIQPAFRGMDAVVHLAASSSVEATWDEVLPNNLIGTYNVYEAASREGVGTVVFASSNHAIGVYEIEGAPELYELDDPRIYDHTVDIRPDSLYGMSKAYGEALGRYYVDMHGLRVFCLRIGSVRDADDPIDPKIGESSPPLLNLQTEEQRYKRMRGTWLSRRDCCNLISRCLDNEDLNWAVVYGISDNPRQFWDISHAKNILGYDPRDSAPR